MILAFCSCALSIESNCAIAGAGGNTKKLHIPNLQKINGVQVVSVANRSLESSKKAAAEFGIGKVRSAQLILTPMPVHTCTCSADAIAGRAALHSIVMNVLEAYWPL